MKDLYILKDRLKEALQMRDMTPKQLSDKSGLYLSTIYRYLNGERIPKTDSIEIMAKVLRVSPAWLLGYEVPPDPPDLTLAKDDLTILIEQLEPRDKEVLLSIVKTLLDKSKEGSDDKPATEV